MKPNLQHTLAEVGISPTDFEAATEWALAAAQRGQRDYDHSDCNGMVSDFDACDHTKPDRAAAIKAEYERYSNLIVVFGGLKRLAEEHGLERGSFDSLSGNT